MNNHLRIAWRTGDGLVPGSPQPADVLSALAHPGGVDLDLTTRDAVLCCRVDLPYPAGATGAWVVTCARCGQTSPPLGVSGRVDDPRSVTLPCMDPPIGR